MGGGQVQIVENRDDGVPGGGAPPGHPQDQLLMVQVERGGGLVQEVVLMHRQACESLALEPHAGGA